MLKIKAPIITYFVTENGLETYNLHKGIKAENVTTLDLPPEIVQEHVRVDKERLLQQKFGCAVVDFATTIIEKFPNNDLGLFYNNLATLTTSTKSFWLGNMILKSNVQGAYAPIENNIQLQQSNYMLTIYHELFHMSSTYYRESDEMIFTGFIQQAKGKSALASGINEGYTQFLTERYFGKNKDVLKAYSYEVHIVERLEMIVGKEKMESLYLKANLQGLVKELSQYTNESTVMEFFDNVDFSGNHLRDKCLSSHQKDMLISKIRRADEFLIKCYAKKLKNELNNSQLDSESLRAKLVMFTSAMGSSITVGKNKFDLITLEEAFNIMFKILDEYKEENINKRNH